MDVTVAGVGVMINWVLTVVCTVLVMGVIERNAEQKELAEVEWVESVDTIASTEDCPYESIVSDHQTQENTLTRVKCTRNGTCNSSGCQTENSNETEKRHCFQCAYQP
jgi:hypothetical protein